MIITRQMYAANSEDGGVIPQYSIHEMFSVLATLSCCNSMMIDKSKRVAMGAKVNTPRYPCHVCDQRDLRVKHATRQCRATSCISFMLLNRAVSGSLVALRQEADLRRVETEPSTIPTEAHTAK